MTHLLKNTALGLLMATVLTCLTATGLSAGPEQRPRTVIELFTSQGCSSCPPADKLLGQLAGRDDVIALTFPVDYWDYLGWKDTLASPAYSARQRAYARARGDGQVYTPQVVIDGAYHAVGSRPWETEKTIAKSRKNLKNDRIPLAARTEGNTLILTAGADREPAPGVVCTGPATGSIATLMPLGGSPVLVTSCAMPTPGSRPKAEVRAQRNPTSSWVVKANWTSLGVFRSRLAASIATATPTRSSRLLAT